MSTVLALALGLFASALPARPAAAPGEAVTPIVDNERVSVRDVTWPKGASSPPMRPMLDIVSVYVAGGTMKVTRPDGKSAIVVRKAGDVVFEPKLTVRTEENVGDGEPVRAIMIALLDHAVRPLPNASGYPNAFPRPGSNKRLDNDRVLVWDYTFTSGEPSPMHFHDKDVVVVYMENGSLRSTTPEGQSQVNPNSFGLTKFNPRNRTHTEQLVTGTSRVIAVELR